MNISYDYYKVFYYVAKHKKITQAAKVLLSNQPNITRTIKLLEDALGCRLLIRSNRGVSLTAEGEKLYAHIKIAFEQIELAEAEISLRKGLQSGVVSVGASEVALHGILLPVLKKYKTLYPGVHMHISNHTTPQAIEALDNSVVDIAVVTTPTDKSKKFAEKNLKQVREVPVCSESFPELKNKRISVRKLAEYPIISLGKHTKTYRLYSDFFEENGAVFKPDIETATADQIIPMVRSGLGIGFVPETFLENEAGVFALELEEKIPKRYICMIKRRDHSLTAAAKELERLLEEAAEKF